MRPNLTDQSKSLATCSLAVVVIALACITDSCPRCLAQGGVIIGPGRGGLGINQGLAAIDLPTDRTMSRGIERAKDRIAAGEFSQALRFLDEVLAGSQDSFIAIGDSGEHVGLKETASKMIRDLPPEGRQLYEATFGPAARRKLSEALASGDTKALREIVWQYLYTPSGQEAAFLRQMPVGTCRRVCSLTSCYTQLQPPNDSIHNSRFWPRGAV
jgi:hypothetical protein